MRWVERKPAADHDHDARPELHESIDMTLLMPMMASLGWVESINHWLPMLLVLARAAPKWMCEAIDADHDLAGSDGSRKLRLLRIL